MVCNGRGLAAFTWSQVAPHEIASLAMPVSEAVSFLTIRDTVTEDAVHWRSNSPNQPYPNCPRSFPHSLRSPGVSFLTKLQSQFQQGLEVRYAPVKHMEERPSACDSEELVGHYYLGNYMLNHTGQQLVNCVAGGCDQEFRTKPNLKKHFECKHGSQ